MDLYTPMLKKKYIPPVVEKIILDNSISLVMMTPNPPPPRDGTGRKGNSDSKPFANPFGDKPFS
jgi:hypothetical protein